MLHTMGPHNSEMGVQQLITKWRQRNPRAYMFKADDDNCIITLTFTCIHHIIKFTNVTTDDTSLALYSPVDLYTQYFLLYINWCLY
jgi:hypothetical protein